MTGAAGVSPVEADSVAVDSVFSEETSSGNVSITNSTSTWKKDSQGKNLIWRKLSKNNSQKESKQASKPSEAEKKHHIFEQLSMYKEE